jgi:hypothetical protein
LWPILAHVACYTVCNMQVMNEKCIRKDHKDCIYV